MSCVTVTPGVAAVNFAMRVSNAALSSARQCANETLPSAEPVAGALAWDLLPPGPAQAAVRAPSPTAPARPSRRRRVRAGGVSGVVPVIVPPRVGLAVGGPGLRDGTVAHPAALPSVPEGRVAAGVTGAQGGPDTVHADRDVAGHGDAAHDAVLVAVVRHPVVLRGAVVPHRHVARLPAPPDRVLQTRDVALQEVDDLPRVRAAQADQPLREAAEQEGAFARLRVDPDDRVLGLEPLDNELVLVGLLLHVDPSDANLVAEAG